MAQRELNSGRILERFDALYADITAEMQDDREALAAMQSKRDQFWQHLSDFNVERVHFNRPAQQLNQWLDQNVSLKKPEDLTTISKLADRVKIGIIYDFI